MRKLTTAFVLVLAACCIGASCSCYRHSPSRRYKEWLQHNLEAVRDFQALAAQLDWHLVVSGWDGHASSIAVLDLATGGYENIYETRSRIWLASSIQDGVLAFVESSVTNHSASIKYDRHFVVLFDVGAARELLRVEVDDRPNCGTDSSVILLTPQEVVFPVGFDVVRLDRKTGRLDVILPHRSGYRVRQIRRGPNVFFVVRAALDYAGELVVVAADDPYGVLSAKDGVWRVVTVGAHTIVQREFRVCKYTWGDDESTELAEGVVLADVGGETFLYTDASGYSKRGHLFLYDMGKCEASDLRVDVTLWSVSVLDSTPFVSPQAGYVFVCYEAGSPPRPGFLPDWEYQVYDLGTGESVGAFHNPYGGQKGFDQVLGWVE